MAINIRVESQHKPLFGSSGIRRTVNKEFIQMGLDVGLAVGSIYPELIVGCDTRTSSDALKRAFVAGVLAAGAKAYDAGTVTTPTVALTARKFAAGAMITASHNPPEYNGIKLLNPDGSGFDAAQRSQIEEIIWAESTSAAAWNKMQSCSPYDGAEEEHIKRILHDFPEVLGLKIVIDAGCGAAFNISPALFTRLGCEIIPVNCTPCGLFPRNPEPVPENLGRLIEMVRDTGADLGIAHDGDADRMMAVDGRGRFIPGDKLLAIFARELGAAEVITTIDASMALEETGMRVTRTRVGDIYVSEELKSRGNFGGEPSGSWVFPAVSLCPDGPYAAVRIAEIAQNKNLAGIVDSLPDYPIRRGSFPKNGKTLEQIRRHLVEQGLLFEDGVEGIKLNLADGWLLLRESGTEPKIRLTVEAHEPFRTQELYDCCMAAIRECTEV